ncbi:MAG TPA: cyanophycinase [Vicinamibacteria bacterium]|nr:cyanophycinase [Vicinamibacteria bacterium]
MKLPLVLCLAAVLAVPAFAQSPSPSPAPSVGPPEIGPARGSLVIVGGGLRSDSILKRFLDLAGGPEASLVVIPTAGESDDLADYAGDLRDLADAGARHVKMMHTRDRKTADSDAFIAPLREARGVWFPGGRHWRLADAYLGTRTQAALRDVLARGGVIGGTSAGATILGSFMVRGDTKGNTIMVGDHVEGFGFLKNVTIDQHLLRRNRQFDLIPVIESHPELLGIGLDEDTAIVVRGDRFEVLGSGYVAIYDRTRRIDSGGQFYLLAPGDRYDLKTREAERPQPRGVPIDRVVKEPWKK